jgi:DNA-binding response OmpR family regulator
LPVRFDGRDRSRSFSFSARVILFMAPTQQSGVIVIVEDPSISRLVKNVLRREGREVVVTGAEHALSLMEQCDSRVKLLITNRPQEFARLDGFVPVLYLASTPDWELAARTRGLRVLQKPFQTKDLVEAVGEIIPGN